jgi:hypothetical protein
MSTLIDEMRLLRGRVEALEARHGPRDAAEAAVLPAIARSIGGRHFTSDELFAHAAVDPALAAALAAADITNTRELGKLLSRLEVQPVAGVSIVRVRDSRCGVIRCVRVSNPQTRTA